MVIPAVVLLVRQLKPRVDGRPCLVVTSETPTSNTFKVSVRANAWDQAECLFADGCDCAGGGQGAGTPTVSTTPKTGLESRRPRRWGRCIIKQRAWGRSVEELVMRTVAVRMVGTSFATAQVMRNEGQGDVDVDGEDTEDQDGKGDSGSDTSKEGQRDSDDEEERHDKGVDGVEERHERLAGHGHEQR